MSKEVVETLKAAKDAVPGVESKLVEMLDALQSGVVKVGEQVVKYSPDAANAALWVVRIDGIQALIYGLIALIASIVFAFKAVAFWRWCTKHLDRSDGGSVVFGVIVSVFFSTLFGYSLAKVLCIWNWIAVIEPKLWLAKKIIASVL